MIDVKIEQSGESNNTNYPYTAIHPSTGLIVVFTEKDGGVSLNGGGAFRERRFFEEAFIPFKGKITLSNK